MSIEAKLFAQILSALKPKLPEYITVVKEPKYTRYFFGDIKELAGQKLRVLDRAANGCGDCLCLTKKGLVDVCAEDIEK
ncbi:MAG: hypothetical protein ABFD76_05095 [Smithella sp.]